MQPLTGALVAQGEMLGGHALRGLGAARRPFDQQPYLGRGTHVQEPGPEPRLPGAQDRRDRERGREPVGGAPADRGQHVGGPGAGTSPMGAGGSEPRICWHSAMLSLLASGGARPIPSTLAASR